MNIDLDSQVLKAFEDLDRLDEGTSSESIEASKRFWAAVRNKKIDERAFHSAFDDELANLGLDNLFDQEGRLKSRSTYAEIKKASEANPDSWAVRAILKLWVLRYKENVLYQVDHEIFAKAEEARKNEEKELVAKKAEMLQKWQLCLIEAFEQLDINLCKEYKNLLGMPVKDCCKITEYVSTNLFKDCDVTLTVKGCPYHYPLLSKAGFDTNLLVKKLTAAITEAINKTKQNNDEHVLSSFDFYSNIQTNQNTRAHLILLGTSNALYDVYIDTSKNVKLSADTSEAIKNFSDIIEDFKVVFVNISIDDNRRNITYHDSITENFFSWDSSVANLLVKWLPNLGKTEQVWGYSDVAKVSTPNNSFYSKMDNIDTWAKGKYVNFATD